MENWCNTKYYHTLYKNRNDAEAKLFISNILKELNPNANDVFLDLACGKGRHSLFINSLGFNVHGIDLSKRNIEHAKKKNNSTATFQVHDMREDYINNHFDVCLNLFTSFGYFDDKNDNQLAVNTMSNSLKKGGKLIIDFMNVKKVIDNLVRNEIKAIDGIEFHLKRKVENNFIIKEIQFTDHEKFTFFEKVNVLTLEDFNHLTNNSGLKILKTWGDYNLNDFDINNSNRLIILAQK